MTIKQTWDAMPTEQQLSWLKADVLKATIKEVTSGEIENFISYYGLEALTHDAWLIMLDRMTGNYLDSLNERRKETGKAEITLASLVFRASKDAVRRAYRTAERQKHDSLTAINTDGQEYNRPITRRSDDTETIACSRIYLADIMNRQDNIGRTVVKGVVYGFTERQISQKARISPPAVHKRICKIRAATASAFA